MCLALDFARRNQTFPRQCNSDTLWKGLYKYSSAPLAWMYNASRTMPPCWCPMPTKTALRCGSSTRPGSAAGQRVGARRPNYPSAFERRGQLLGDAPVGPHRAVRCATQVRGPHEGEHHNPSLSHNNILTYTNPHTNTHSK
jgi:hypothetical protein